MEFRKFGNKYIVRLNKGEEIIETLKKLCQDENITLGSIQGIGAVSNVKVGLFKPSLKEYHSIELKGDYEMTCLLGNVSTMNGEVYLHLHIDVADEENKIYGGHLNSAVISATGEIIIDTIDGKVDREFSDEIGLNLYKFN
ncbi:hypothetical protein SAMN05428976_1086 [Clostridium sp. USBA 49]|jgi:hypothetical protein|uniref:PPC domain-containing DNA-binding protein n=1 Tax=Clostridium TaxID=1485 RepID=UPI00099A4A66|nr:MULTISPECIES: PPC domain-containing DNA-binding protein [Clostridium]SKA85788.1 hypothetical protein SAMN05428976_1086 [Clostridium sp. USBA 49]